MNQARCGEREKWRQIIKSQRTSGQTITAYCREHGVSQASFFAWRRRFRPAWQAKQFVEIKDADTKPPHSQGNEANASAVEVFLGGGRRLMLDGIDLRSVKRGKRYQRKKK